MNFNWHLIGSVLFGSNGYHEIHNHAKEGDSESVKRYLERGGDPNVKSVNGITPLYLATEAGHFETIRLLVEGGADVNQKLDGDMDFTPIFQAAYQNRDDIVEFFLENGAEKDIFLSAVLEDIEEIKKYAEGGGNLNASRGKGTSAFQFYLSGETLLHLATWRDSVSTVSCLFEHGAEIDICDSYGRTPLHNAAAHNSKNVAQLLIEKGADVNAMDSGKETPLHKAASRNCSEMVELLIAAGADINAEDHAERTPLHRASSRGYVEVIKVLLDNGAYTTYPNASGHTALELAKFHGQVKAIKLFKSYGVKR